MEETTLLASSGWTAPMSFSYDDGNSVVMLPAALEDNGRIVRLARIDSSVARIFCTDTNTGLDVMWPEELSVSLVGWLESVGVPVHRGQEVYISCRVRIHLSLFVTSRLKKRFPRENRLRRNPSP